MKQGMNDARHNSAVFAFAVSCLLSELLAGR